MNTLLHICCAPCANQCIEVLRADGFETTGFWYNPNIHPVTEYRARRNCLEDYAKQIQLPLILNHNSGGFINDKAVLVFGIFFIAVHGKGAHALAVSSFYIKVAADFDGCIPTIGIVYQVFQRNDQIIGGGIGIQAIVIVVDSNKPYSHKGKYLLKIFSHFNVVSAETGKVFDDHTIYLTGANIGKHILKMGAVKIDTAVPIVRPLLVYLDFGMGFQKIMYQISLIADTVAFNLIAVRNRKAII